MIGHCHFGRTVAYQQQVFQLGGIFLEQQEYAQHQDVERQDADEQSHARNDTCDEAQEVSCLSGVQVISFGFIVLLLEIVGDGCIRGVLLLLQ